MSERHGDRVRCQRGRTRRLRRRWRLRHLIEALRARILTPIDPVNATGGHRMEGGHGVTVHTRQFAEQWATEERCALEADSWRDPKA
jgi:hypothetical protein